MTRRMRGTAAILAAAALCALLAGCAPEPAPTPTPTGFASEEEAFAAAEATYRAYVDAVNARRTDADSQPAPNDFLSGSALQDSIDGAGLLEDAGRHIVGATEAKSIERIAASQSSATLAVCVDSSQTRVLDSHGADVTPTDRAETFLLRVEVVYAVPQPLILRSDPDGDGSC
ncbi:hypothetical protein [Microbacterium sp.]|uniref:hypothetical protein n=1 Tax=Microbacterium sp. TaxID=51671 RepID=UPI0039E3CE44